MSVEQYITTAIPTVTSSDQGSTVLKIMEEWRVSQLPVVDNNRYIALISEDDLLNWEHPENTIASVPFQNLRTFVINSDHPYTAAKKMAENDICLIPVLDETGNYLGVVKRKELFHFFCDNSGLNQSGGVMVLSMAPHDYSLSEIARICENNDVVMLNLQLFTHPGTNRMDVILKTGSKDLRGLKASFERYEYHVMEVYGEVSVGDDLQDRYQLLMNYINM